MATKKLQAYISGPLTDVPDERRPAIKKFYENLGAAFEAVARDEFGIKDVVGYVPHHHGDPILFPNLTPQEIKDMHTKSFKATTMLVMYTGLPAHGVGREHEWALAAGIPIVSLCEADRIAQRKVSRLARVDITEELAFGSYDEAVELFKKWLRQYLAAQ